MRTKIQEIPEGLFEYTTEVTTFFNTFQNCTVLMTIPDTIFDTNTNVTDLRNTFLGDIAVTHVPELWVNQDVRFPLLTHYASCFAYVMLASNWKSIPSTWK